MKKLVLILISCFALSLSGNAQEVVQTGSKTFEVKKKQKENTEPTNTGYVIVVDGITYPIYKGARGGYYYLKDGKKKYVPAEVKQKLKEAGV